MAQPATATTHIVNVNLSNCKDCQKKLKKQLRKTEDVTSFHIEAEENLVYVTGKMEGIELVTMMNELLGEKAKAKAKIMSANDMKRLHRKQTSFGYDDKRKHGHEEEKNYSSSSGSHKAEPYVDSGVDKNVCRDIHCKTHFKKPIISEPSQDSIVNFRPPPPLSYMHHGMSSMYPPRPPPPPYGHRWQPPMRRQSYAYGYPRGLMNGFGDYSR